MYPFVITPNIVIGVLKCRHEMLMTLIDLHQQLARQASRLLHPNTGSSSQPSSQHELRDYSSKHPNSLSIYIAIKDIYKVQVQLILVVTIVCLAWIRIT